MVSCNLPAGELRNLSRTAWREHKVEKHYSLGSQRLREAQYGGRAWWNMSERIFRLVGHRSSVTHVGFKVRLGSCRASSVQFDSKAITPEVNPGNGEERTHCC